MGNIIDLKNIIAPSFYNVHRDIKNHTYREYLLRGGRASTKSSFIAFEVIFDILKNKNHNAIVFMKQDNRIKEGAYSLYLSVLSRLNILSEFKILTSPMKIIYKKTGQYILFKGFDDPEKSRGISTNNNNLYFANLHFEEVNQFDGVSEINEIKRSIIRGGDNVNIFYCYNPPASVFHWCNKWYHENIKGRLTHHSTYLDVPKDWLGKACLEEIESLKEINELEYRHAYLGEEIGTGGTVFNNIEFREITDSEIEGFDCIFQGFDWGWFPDPAVFVRLHYDIKNRTIYIIDEIVGNKCTIEEYARQIINMGYNDYLVTIDGAIPEQEFRFRQAGINAMRAVKGPGSIELGITWLENKKFVVDESRTPFTCKELREFEYATDKNGEYTGQYMEFNNHSIDAIRYAFIDSYIRRYPDIY